jgi:hypothetical protein
LLLQPLAISNDLLPASRELRVALTMLQAVVGDAAEVAAARATLQAVRAEGWSDPRLWLAMSYLLERSGEIGEAIENLAAPPVDLTKQVRDAGERLCRRLGGG